MLETVYDGVVVTTEHRPVIWSDVWPME